MQTLSARTSHKYVGSYQHLDDWQDIGTVKTVQSGTLESQIEDDDYTDPRTSVLIVSVDADEGTTPDQIKTALQDMHTSHGCGHEYDCCGCRSYSADAMPQPYTDSNWIIIIKSSCNY